MTYLYLVGLVLCTTTTFIGFKHILFAVSYSKNDWVWLECDNTRTFKIFGWNLGQIQMLRLLACYK
jgi:hypothetical protein